MTKGRKCTVGEEPEVIGDVTVGDGIPNVEPALLLPFPHNRQYGREQQDHLSTVDQVDSCLSVVLVIYKSKIKGLKQLN